MIIYHHWYSLWIGHIKYILANDYGERICDCNIGKFYGKLAYMAPEVWTGSRAAGPTCDGIPADVWSLCKFCFSSR